MGLIERHRKARKELFNALDNATPQERINYSLFLLGLAVALTIIAIPYFFFTGWH